MTEPIGRKSIKIAIEKIKADLYFYANTFLDVSEPSFFGLTERMREDPELY